MSISSTPEAPYMPQPQRATSIAWLGLFCIRAYRVVCPLPLAPSGLSVLFSIHQMLSTAVALLLEDSQRYVYPLSKGPEYLWLCLETQQWEHRAVSAQLEQTWPNHTEDVTWDTQVSAGRLHFLSFSFGHLLQRSGHIVNTTPDNQQH